MVIIRGFRLGRGTITHFAGQLWVDLAKMKAPALFCLPGMRDEELVEAPRTGRTIWDDVETKFKG
jgi:hypothetical protein